MVKTGWNIGHISSKQPLSGQHIELSRLILQYMAPNASLLDIGCGVGNLLRLVHQGDPSIEIIAADPYKECLEATKKRVPAARTILIQAEPFSPAEVGSGFDGVVMCHSLEHMRAPIEVLHSITNEVLKPGGLLFLAVPNPARPQVLFSNIFRSHYVNRGHIYAWDRSHWINFLENICQLQVVEYGADEVILFPRRLTNRIGPIKRFERASARLFPWWAFSNIAVVKAPE